MHEIPVGGSGLVALVDDQDYELVSSLSWSPLKCVGDLIYARRKWTEDGRRKSQLMHNLIMGCKGIDHKDHNGLNNQRSNLRVATRSQNLMNARKRVGALTSQYKGVFWERGCAKWRALIGVGAGKQKHLGLFDDEITAARAYDVAAIERFGEFAVLNFDDYPESRTPPA